MAERLASTNNERATAFGYPEPPQPDKYSKCVHCGFCLEVCPTYQQSSDENHSPRGRVYLIKQAALGDIPLDEAVIDPVMSCLDCRACESVCPSGVEVGNLIEHARGQIYAWQAEQGRLNRIQQFTLHHLFPHPKRLRWAGKFLQFYHRSGWRGLAHKIQITKLLPQHLRDYEEILPTPSSPTLTTWPPVTSPKTSPKGRVGLLTGCVMDALMSPINEATIRVVVHNGWEVVIPSQQVCCGALHVHAGDRHTARSLARTNIHAFFEEDVDYVVTNSAGCGAAMKEYPDLFEELPEEEYDLATRFAKKVRDVSEFLVETGFDPPKQAISGAVTYHDACHLCHAQKIRHQPRYLIQSIPGIQFEEMPNADRCCGSAGIYNLTHPDMAGKLLDQKVEDIPPDVDTVVLGNPGCLLQIKAGLNKHHRNVKVVHTVELLDLAYQQESGHES
ncbi:(Fe-S)-binding protein [Sulfobacillus thermosulfidooxidans]|uniref:(Fe-S)-binding protein n=1 Tax=Sulfobacillus thermosulfidooxidans TaxID=28034 RepID=UPI0006B512E1|nr:(Fe-S)-binding protein [Sulfobacillus thermosulfidooxidans]